MVIITLCPHIATIHPYDSPCIDAGNPAILDEFLDCDWGLGESRSDIGAYGGVDYQMDIDDQVLEIPNQITLGQNYPNPFNAMTTIQYTLPTFNAMTTIQYTLPTANDVIIDIYDVLGRKVETLVDKKQQAGYHQVVWNATNKASGIYFYKIQSRKNAETKKMVLLK